MNSGRRGALPGFSWIICLLIGACSTEGSGPEAATFRDSAGVTIVSSASPSWTERSAWRIVADPELRIGAVDGEQPYLLDRVTDAALLSDGRLIVVNGGTQEIRFFDKAGQHLGSVGGSGEGPGEFLGMQSVFVMPGDSLFVPDPINSRFSVLDPHGQYVRSYTAGWGLASPRGRMHDGRLVALNFADARLATSLGYTRVPMSVLLYMPDGRQVDTVATLLGSEEFRVEVERGLANNAVPFGAQQMLFIAGDRLYTGTGETLQIEVRRGDGTLDRLIRGSLSRRAVRPTDIDAWKRRRLERATERSRPVVERLVRDVPIPSTMPVYSEIIVDSSDNIWTRGFAPENEPDAAWQVFDSEGRWLGGIPLPIGLRVMRIGPDYVLGIMRDTVDVEYVQLHRIVKRTR